MQKLNKKYQLLLYAFAGMGVNMLNLMMGSYLCSAIIASGFAADKIDFQTFQQTDLVIAGVWAVFGAIAKIIDGVIDIPMASFADNLRTRLGRRRPAIIIGLIPMVAAYLLFLVVPNPGRATMLNTVYLGIVLCIFYSFYTLTMVTYYATYTEIVDNTDDRNFMSNAKSVFDIFYFILGYVAVSAMLKGINITRVALMVLPIVLTMIIPLFMIKEPDNRKSSLTPAKTISLVQSIKYTFKNKAFILWMLVYAFMTFGVQLFLGGINEYFGDVGMDQTLVMMSSFAPVPFALIFYNRLIKKRGFGFAFRYALICYTIGMASLFASAFIPRESVMRTVMPIASGVICSLAVGALFSVAYSIPAELAACEAAESGTSNSAMYFAVQGLFAGVATAIGSYVVLNLLKVLCGEIADPYTVNPMYFLTLICALGTLAAFLISFILPEKLINLGKGNSEGNDEKKD